MRILEVLPTYPGQPFDGSAVYERNLNRALLTRGATVHVLTTTTARLLHTEAFYIRWPHELPAHDEHEGVSIRRFRALDPGRLGHAASDAVLRRWSYEDYREGAVSQGSARFADAYVAQARKRPTRIDAFADIGRGPLVPGLLAHLRRVASRFDVILAGYAPFSLGR